MPAPPITRTASPETLVFGIGSHLKFGEQPNLTTAATRKRDETGEFSRYNVAVNSMTVSPTSTLLTPGVIPTTVEQPAGVPGPVSIAGNFVVDALPRRMELFWRQLLNAPSSNITDITSGASVGDQGSQTILSATAISGTRTAILAAALTNQIDSGDPAIQLRVSLAGTGIMVGSPAAAIGANNPVRIEIAGTDTSDNAFTETVSFIAGATSVTTNSYFKTITSVTSLDIIAGTTVTVAISGESVRKGVQIVSDADYRLTPGLTIEAVNGKVPNTIVDAFLNNFSFTATREENVTYTFGLTGRLFEPGLSPDGDTLPFGNGDRRITAGRTRPGSSTTGAYGDGAFGNIQDDQTPFAGYNCCLGATISGSRVAFPHLTGASLTIDTATQFTPRLYTLFPGVAYNRQRTITGEVTLEYHTTDKGVVNDYLAGRVWDDVEIGLLNNGLGARPDETRFIFDKIQLSEFPSIPIESDDFVTQTIRFIALPSSGTAADAIKIQSYYEFIQGSDALSKSNLALLDLTT